MIATEEFRRSVGRCSSRRPQQAARSQSASFRQMSAADHDAAARTAPDATVAEEHTEAATRLRADERSACYGGVRRGPRHGALVTRRQRDRGRSASRSRRVPQGTALRARRRGGLPSRRIGDDAAVARPRAKGCVPHGAPRGRRAGAASLSAFSVPNAEVTVSSTQVGFRVTITSSHDRDAAAKRRRAWARARAGVASDHRLVLRARTSSTRGSGSMDDARPDRAPGRVGLGAADARPAGGVTRAASLRTGVA